MAAFSPTRGPILAAAALLAAACDPPPPRMVEHEVEFRVSSDIERPISGADLWLGDHKLGTTGKDGSLRVDLRVEDGATLRVQPRCPPGFIDPEGVRLTLRSFKGLAGDSSLRVSFVCPRAQRLGAVVVRAAGFADLPVLFNGEEITRTDSAGVAHLSMQAPPHTSFTVALNTTGVDRLRPVNPTASFSLGDADDVFLFDAPLYQEPLPKKPHHRHHRKPPPKPKLPVRIESNINPWRHR